MRLYNKNLDSILQCLKGVKKQGAGHVACCPAHNDQHQSLSLSQGDDGRVLLHCHAGCSPEEVVRALGLEMKDLYPSKERNTSRSISSTYTYTDVDENVLYQTLRTEPKGFYQRRPDGKGGWINNLQGVKPVPYGLPQLIEKIKASLMILIVEGEKDVDDLHKRGFPATCNHGGAGKWSDEYHSKYFPPGTKVSILPDNDQAGQKHAEKIKEQLLSRGCKVKIINLPYLKEKEDVSDWFDKGNSTKDLYTLIVEEWGEHLSEYLDEYVQDKEESLDESQTASVMPFPLESLPDCFQDYVKESAAALCCPPDFIALPLLVTAGGVIGNTRRIEVKDSWTEGAGLYAAVVGDPASKKSPAQNKASFFIKELASKLLSKYENDLKEYKDKMSSYEVDYERWRQGVKRAGSAKADGFDPGPKPDEPKRPSVPRLYAVDVTTEALSEILQENHRGITIIRDELSAWVKSMDQYKGGKGSDKEFFLSCWSGAPIHVDRKGKDPILIDRPFLSVVGCIPPDVMPELTSNDNRHDGFIDRLLFAYPEPVEQRWNDSGISDGATYKAYQCFKSLMDFDFAHGNTPVKIKLDIFARSKFIEWHDKHYAEIKEISFPDVLRGPWGKMPGQAARLALIIHSCRQITENAGSTIDELTISRTLNLVEYFKNHARKVFSVLDESIIDKNLRRLLEWLAKKEIDTVKPRDVQKSRVAGCKTSKQARDLLDTFCEAGFGCWSDDKKKVIILRKLSRQHDISA